ncbi:hypothetical protein J3F84DRAFT_190290 [Trichoderma pleuroticola]
MPILWLLLAVSRSHCAYQMTSPSQISCSSLRYANVLSQDANVVKKWCRAFIIFDQDSPPNAKEWTVEPAVLLTEMGIEEGKA